MMNQLKTAFWMVLLTVLLVLIGRVWLGNGGMVLFLGVAVVMELTELGGRAALAPLPVASLSLV